MLDILDKDVRWVIALKAEAQPIIRALNLFRVHDPSGNIIYKNKIGTHWLVISGVGKKNVNSAVTYLRKVSKARKWALWVNLGIAGSSRGKYGELLIVDKATNASSGQLFFPGTVTKTKLQKAELFTVDKPLFDYSNIDLVDMEGAEFIRVATKISYRELVLVMKVISDGPDQSGKGLRKRDVSALIKKNIALIMEQVKKVSSLITIERDRLVVPKEYERIIRRWHFTVSQSHELEKLIRRWVAITGSDQLTQKISKFKNSRDIITFLYEYLENYEIDWSET